MARLTIEIPEKVDRQLEINKMTHKDLGELFLSWVQVYLSDSNRTFLKNPLLIKPAQKCPPLSSILGTGQGSFSTPEEADAFIRAERKAWTFLTAFRGKRIYLSHSDPGASEYIYNALQVII